MACSGDKGAPSHPVPLIKRVLHGEESVRIGRKPSCELSVKCPFISGTHCKVDVTGPARLIDLTATKESSSLDSNSASGELRFFVRDLSSNGTWVVKSSHNESLGDNGKHVHAKKLEAKSEEELAVGDCILLLAPSHKESAQYRFMLSRRGSEYKLEQLPVSYKLKKMANEAVERTSGEEGTVAALDGAEHGNESLAANSTKRSTSSACSDATRKKLRVDESSTSTSKTAPLFSVEASLGSSPTGADKEEMERCPNCWKLFPVHDLPLHCPICQDSAAKRTSSSLSEREDAGVSSPAERREESASHVVTDDCMEQCPHCLALFPLDALISHAETCSLASSSSSSYSRGGSTGSCHSASSECAKSAKSEFPIAEPVFEMSTALLSRDTSMEQCPFCSNLMTLSELIPHCSTCRLTSRLPHSRHAHDLSDTEEDGVVPKRTKYTLETFEKSSKHPSVGDAIDLPGVSCTSSEGEVRERLPDGADELEQCVHCLKEFPISKIVSHASACSAAAKEAGSDSCVLEHCQHCLSVFPLNELVTHALNCSQRRDVGSLDTEDGVFGDEEMWGEPLERCMHCFKDFPLSKMVDHTRKCRGDMLGSRERFKNFLPSVHDLDAMSLAVLNDAQMRAVEYVMEVSKKESESVYTQLRDRIIGLGYTEHDLEKTLQWIRQDAPIIIHLNLDRVLQFLVKDTHYRNLFETHTGSGSLDKSARSGWEDRIFNSLYKGSAPVDRVKYGVLNIVGDPRGVSCCSGYGDSFLQLKKVRLRTTFASQDTSSSAVVLSCCEHYGNVLYRYNNSELKAILEVATRRVEFLRSDMISNYKEIQIHGPVCLSENVDCIVVNNRHGSDPAMRDLLDQFVTRNKCNLIWMEPADRIDYPSFTHAPAHLPSFVLPHPPLYAAAPVPPPAPPTSRRHHKRKRRRRSRDHDWY